MKHAIWDLFCDKLSVVFDPNIALLFKEYVNVIESDFSEDEYESTSVQED